MQRDCIKPNLDSQMKHLTPSDESDDEEVFEWVQCDSCKKWRRMTKGHFQAAEAFYCNMIRNVHCDIPEDVLDDGETWDGLIYGGPGASLD